MNPMSLVSLCHIGVIERNDSPQQGLDTLVRRDVGHSKSDGGRHKGGPLLWTGGPCRQPRSCPAPARPQPVALTGEQDLLCTSSMFQEYIPLMGLVSWCSPARASLSRPAENRVHRTILSALRVRPASLFLSLSAGGVRIRL